MPSFKPLTRSRPRSESMDFSLSINALLIAAIIVVIEVVKQILKEAVKVVVPVWVWKLAVLVLGVAAAIITGGYETTKEFILACVLYAAAASLFYQTGKMSVTAIQDMRKNGQDT